jgi:hypothetical protein
MICVIMHRDVTDCCSPDIGCRGGGCWARSAHSHPRTPVESKIMKTKIQTLKLGLVALLLVTLVQSSSAAPPRTGIRGQTFIYQPGFAVEVSPGVWIGDGGFSFPSPASFTILAARSGRVVRHVSSDANGSFQVSLPPGRYVIVPDTSFGLTPTTGPFVVTVRARHLTDMFIYYESSPIFAVASP